MYKEGQIFIWQLPQAVVSWCNESGQYHIIEIYRSPEGYRQWQIVANPKLSEPEMVKIEISRLEEYLRTTDWYAVRYAETGILVPGDVQEARQRAREEIDRLRNKLSS